MVTGNCNSQMHRVGVPGMPPVDRLTLTASHWPPPVDSLPLTGCHWLPLIDRLSLTAFHWLLPSSPAIPLDHALHMHLKTCLITAFKFTQSLPPSASNPAWLWPPTWHEHCLQVHHQTPSITDSKCLSEIPSSSHRSGSPKSLHYRVQVNLWVHSISASKCISKLVPSCHPSRSLIALDDHLQTLLELPLCTTCTQSRYIVCRFGNYIDT